MGKGEGEDYSFITGTVTTVVSFVRQFLRTFHVLVLHRSL